MPNLDRWQRNTLAPIIRYNQKTGENLPLPACYEFLHDAYFQQRILEKVDDYYLTTEWENLAENSKRQQEDVLLAIHNRIAKYAQDETLRRILGQAKTTVDFGECMDKGKILLFDTSAINISQEASRLLSIVSLKREQK
jgi:5-methylthioribose kinase